LKSKLARQQSRFFIFHIVKTREEKVEDNKYFYCGMAAFEGCRIIRELTEAILVLRGIDTVNAIIAQIVSNKKDLSIAFVLQTFVKKQTDRGENIQGKEFCQIINCTLQESCEQRKGRKFIDRKPPGIAKESGGIFGPVLPKRIVINGSNLPT